MFIVVGYEEWIAQLKAGKQSKKAVVSKSLQKQQAAAKRLRELGSPWDLADAEGLWPLDEDLLKQWISLFAERASALKEIKRLFGEESELHTKCPIVVFNSRSGEHI